MPHDALIPLTHPSNLSKLSPCALQCVIGTVGTAKCASPLDTKCICTPNFTNLASACLAAKCPLSDAVPALAMQRTMCPDLGLPDLSTLSSCTQVCVIKTLGATHCSGPLDKDCICGMPFKLNVGGCLLGCGLQDLAPALQMEIGICDPNTPGKCSATGLWRILQPQCWFGGW